MKKIIILVIIISVFFSMVANGETIKNYNPIINGKSVKAEEFLPMVYKLKGIPLIYDSYLSEELVDLKQANPIFAWLGLNERETVARVITKVVLIAKLARLTMLSESQIEVILPENLPYFISFKNFYYSVLCILLHPITSQRINCIVDNTTQIELNSNISINSPSEEQALCDAEMLMWFAPQTITIYSEDEVLKNIRSQINSFGKREYRLFRKQMGDWENESYATKNEKSVTIYCSYSASWLHIVALRDDSQIYSEAYEQRIKEWVEQYSNLIYVNLGIYNDCAIAKECMKAICASTEYDYEGELRVCYVSDVIQYGAVLCTGYSDALKFLANLYGLDCVTVVDAGYEHAWCKIKVDGEWFNYDPTFYDDTIRSCNWIHQDDEHFALRHSLEG